MFIYLVSNTNMVADAMKAKAASSSTVESERVLVDNDDLKAWIVTALNGAGLEAQYESTELVAEILVE